MQFQAICGFVRMPVGWFLEIEDTISKWWTLVWHLDISCLGWEEGGRVWEEQEEVGGGANKKKNSRIVIDPSWVMGHESLFLVGT